jgi:two-component system, response regulator PdtaR
MDQARRVEVPAILVVEDEALVRMYLVDAIELEGLKAYEAANADDAILIMEAHSDIRVLFTDIDMPGSMDGIKLSHYVSNRWPPARVFIASGRVIPLDDQLVPRSTFLRKPYSTSDLQQVFDAAKAD